MNTALIIHGIGGHAGIHWQRWLHDELQARDYTVLMPDLPNPAHPDRQAWLTEIVKAVKGVDPAELTVVGHSLGVTTALDFLEQIDGVVRELVCVAGFAEAYGAELNEYFLAEKSIDFSKVKRHVGKAVVIYGDNDPYVTQDALRYVADSLDTEPVIIVSGGHLNSEAGFTEFPRLLELL